MSEEPRKKLGKVLDPHPESTKHTVPDGRPHEPVDSPLIRNETKAAFEDLFKYRRDQSMPIDKARSSPGGQVIFANSMTSSADLNPGKYREWAAVVKDSGDVVPIHVFPHSDDKLYEEKREVERRAPKFRYVVDPEDEGK